MSESEDQEIPQYFKDGVIAFSNAFFAYITNQTATAFPLSLKAHLYEAGTWQSLAIEKLGKTLFRGLSIDKVHGKSGEYRLGYMFGMLESALSPSTEQANFFEDVVSETYLGNQMNSVDDSEVERFEEGIEKLTDGYTLTQTGDYLRGQVEGLKSVVIEDGEFRYDSDASSAYSLMLILQSQMGYLESWKDFHVFIGSSVDGYEDESRFDACKKMGQAIGFSPKKERLKKRAKSSGDL